VIIIHLIVIGHRPLDLGMPLHHLFFIGMPHYLVLLLMPHLVLLVMEMLIGFNIGRCIARICCGLRKSVHLHIKSDILVF